MKFKINNREWEISEVSEEDILVRLNAQNDGNEYYAANGMTNFQHQYIYLNRSLNEGFKRITLMHELTHVYIRSYMQFSMLEMIEEEQICDLVANSHDIIHEIVEEYFNGRRNKKNS